LRGEDGFGLMMTLAILLMICRLLGTMGEKPAEQAAIREHR